MLSLSDRGKYAFIKLKSWRYFAFFLLLILLFSGSYISFYKSSPAVEDEIAARFSMNAENSPNKNFEVYATSDSVKSKSEYASFFGGCRDLFLSNRYVDYFDSYCGYISNGTKFGQYYSYLCKELLDGSVEPISVFASPLNSINESKGKYIHEIWLIDLMFPRSVISSTDGEISSNFAYIPISYANSILRKMGVQKPSLDDYNNLLGSTIHIEFYDKAKNESTILNWCIANIIFENAVYEYFASKFGHVIFSYTNLPVYEYPSVAISFGHSRFACKDYLQRLTNGKYFNYENLLFSVVNGKSNFPNDYVTNENINDLIYTFYKGGNSINFCLAFYLFFVAIFLVFFILLQRHAAISFINSFFVSSLSIFAFYLALGLYCSINGSFVITFCSLFVVVSYIFALFAIIVSILLRKKICNGLYRVAIDEYKI